MITIYKIKRKDFYFYNGKLFIKPNIYSFDSFLRCYFSYILNKTDGLLVHSSCINVNKKTFLFVAKSGGGKSTIAKIFSGFNVLSDELVALRIIKNNIFVYSTPFWGEIESNSKESFKFKLNKIFFIKKSDKNFEQQINKKTAFIKFLKCIMNFSNDGNIIINVIKKASLILSQTPFCTLHFKKDKSLINYLSKPD